MNACLPMQPGRYRNARDEEDEGGGVSRFIDFYFVHSNGIDFSVPIAFTRQNC